jgi:hypothetical protein
LFQRTLDRRVVSFLATSGYEVVECETGVTRTLDRELAITTYTYSGDDAYCAIRVADITILNLNDCVVRSLEAAQAVKASLPANWRKIDLLFTQFGYANWIGNEPDVELRREAAEEKLTRIAYQVEVLEPTVVVPFGSYFFFCHPENFYLNSQQNTPGVLRASSVLTRWQSRIRFLKPGDEIRFANGVFSPAKFDELSGAAEQHWQAAFSCIQPNVAPPAAAVASDVLLRNFRAYRRKMAFHFLLLPQLLELAGFIRPVDVQVADDGTVLRLSYISKPRALAQGSPWRLSMSSSSLNFVFMNEFGFNSTHCSGRFRLRNADDMPAILKFFILQDAYKNGYGLKNPAQSILFFWNSLKKLLFHRHAAV